MKKNDKNKLAFIEQSSALVGGAVRDTLLNLNPKDLDYVLEGFTHQDMLDAGFRTNDSVNGSFPVYRHPITNDEYALARVEKNTGNGYRDFETVTNGVTIIQDLGRRDITINAMAMKDGTLIDPHSGASDLKNKIIRHINNEAFAEDPVRILRIARFSARYSDFTIAPETITLIKNMVNKGDLNHLTKERVWLEISKVLQETKPSIFFYVLKEIGALEILFPELQAMVGCQQKPTYHAEGDVFIHTMMVLDEGAKLTKDMDSDTKISVGWGCITHDIGKPHVNPAYQSKPHSHIGHDLLITAGPHLDTLNDRIGVPVAIKKLSALCIEAHQQVHAIFAVKTAKGIADFFENHNLKNEDRRGIFLLLLLVCDADEKGRFLRSTHANKVPNTPLVSAFSNNDVILAGATGLQRKENDSFAFYKSNSDEVYKQKTYLLKMFDAYIKISLNKADQEQLSNQKNKILKTHSSYIEKITLLVKNKDQFLLQKEEADRTKNLNLINAPKAMKALKFVDAFKKIQSETDSLVRTKMPNSY